MGRTLREDVRIEQRRQQVADLYLRSWTQAAIARELAVSQATVSADLKAIRREWRDSQIRDFDEAVAIELRTIGHLEREAWSGWERSQQPAESTKVIQDGGGKKAEKTVRQQQGDPRYLELVHRTIAGRRALLGLDAPTRIAPTSPDGDESYHAHVMQELLRLAEQTSGGPTMIDADFVEQRLAGELRTAATEQATDAEGESNGRQENEGENDRRES